MAAAILRGLFAILGFPARMLFSLLGQFARWSGGGNNFAAAISHNIVANVICNTVAWLAVAAGVWTGAQAVWDEPWPEPCTGVKLCIAVAGLEGDDANASQSKYVRRALDTAYGSDRPEGLVHVVNVPRKLERDYSGDSAENRAKAEHTGRKWLARLNADILVYGVVVESGQAFDLYFLLGKTDADACDNTYVTERFRLEARFAADTAAALAAVAVSAVMPVCDRRGQYLVEILKPFVARLERLVESSPASLAGDSRASVFHAYALAMATIGEQSEDSDSLEKAIAAYREALKEWTRARVPLDWAMTQNNMGVALRSLGERESGTARLTEAVRAYSEALKEYTRNRVPLQWAAIQNNLGAALRDLGERRGDETALEDAIAAFRGALEEYEKAGASHYAEVARRNLARAEAKLAELRKRDGAGSETQPTKN